MLDLYQAAVELQRFCDGRNWANCFIGGIAVQRWGEPRLTRDVDLTLYTGFGDQTAVVDSLLSAFPGRGEGARDFALRHRVLLLQAPGRAIGIDVSLAGLPFERRMIERATPFAFSPHLTIRTCSSEDLIVMKLFASRALDIRDAETVAIRQAGKLDWRYIEEQLGPLAELKEDPAILRELARIRQLDAGP